MYAYNIKFQLFLMIIIIKMSSNRFLAAEVHCVTAMLLINIFFKISAHTSLWNLCNRWEGSGARLNENREAKTLSNHEIGNGREILMERRMLNINSFCHLIILINTIIALINIFRIIYLYVFDPRWAAQWERGNEMKWYRRSRHFYLIIL